MAELPAGPGPNHFARILDTDAEVSRMAREGISSDTELKKTLQSFQGQPRILNGLIHTTFRIKPRFYSNPQ